MKMAVLWDVAPFYWILTDVSEEFTASTISKFK
jgi:hypothetical protein